MTPHSTACRLPASAEPAFGAAATTATDSPSQQITTADIARRQVWPTRVNQASRTAIGLWDPRKVTTWDRQIISDREQDLDLGGVTHLL